MRSAPSQEEAALKMMNGTCLNMQDLQEVIKPTPYTGEETDRNECAPWKLEVKLQKTRRIFQLIELFGKRAITPQKLLTVGNWLR
ncbi:hypothetical protein Y1Q_0010671 [Alligator mississippiensis]|uniref:Uncharacterized protein n=1 Tax=Alligator mississippiensis TaxID=8496 RepID=A0A151M6D0_ALLMI|nr:hypothetical protein Y1Q_0010671 [Alligator mississippiensis]